jgi:predicted DNA-binding ribbon-helix-helix protein
MAKQMHSADIRCVSVGKQVTTINIESPFWERFRIIAAQRNVAISQLLAEIDRTMPRQRPILGKRRVRSLSAAVRIFVLENIDHSRPSGGR